MILTRPLRGAVARRLMKSGDSSIHSSLSKFLAADGYDFRFLGSFTIAAIRIEWIVETFIANLSDQTQTASGHVSVNEEHRRRIQPKQVKGE